MDDIAKTESPMPRSSVLLEGILNLHNCIVKWVEKRQEIMDFSLG